jgi:hypothetical protein
VKPAEIPEGEKVLSLAEAAEIVPHSETSLYRIARKQGPDCPFTKKRGRWGTTRSKLLTWWEAGDSGAAPRGSSDPTSPVRRGRSSGGALAKVRELRPKGNQAA